MNERIKKILKVILPLIISVSIISSTYYLRKIEIKSVEKKTILQNELLKNVCEKNFKDLTIRNQCEWNLNECKKLSSSSIEGVIYCLASSMAIMNSEFVNRICENLEGDNRNWCMAIGFSSIDKEKAGSYCEEMSNEESKLHCHAMVVGNLDEGLKWCDKISSYDWRNNCKANLYTNIDKNESKKYCEMIKDEGIRNACLQTFAS